ncbi:MAG: hypothetical protein FWB84_06295 [Candidatus Bathyarchaeota archaeon]|uniref:hypothetical protein n=1 Tax=Candidatus Bathycorpusculum sp. TaxID=2994959 RepID=UPI0028387D92|nr:hypothetical protein [Candidatus Termiticorpusculum sp.]
MVVVRVVFGSNIDNPSFLHNAFACLVYSAIRHTPSTSTTLILERNSTTSTKEYLQESFASFKAFKTRYAIHKAT